MTPSTVDVNNVEGPADDKEVVGGGTAAFLKLGSLGFGFGAEKKEESDFDSLTDDDDEAVADEAEEMALEGSFSFLTMGFDDEEATACFLAGGAAFAGGSSDFRFLAN